MYTRQELENFDTPCQYIHGKKDVCMVVRSHLELYNLVDKVRALLAEKEKEIKVLSRLVKEQISERKYGIPYYGLSREQLIELDGEFEQALAELEPSDK